MNELIAWLENFTQLEVFVFAFIGAIIVVYPLLHLDDWLELRKLNKRKR